MQNHTPKVRSNVLKELSLISNFEKKMLKYLFFLKVSLTNDPLVTLSASRNIEWIQSRLLYLEDCLILDPKANPQIFNKLLMITLQAVFIVVICTKGSTTGLT